MIHSMSVRSNLSMTNCYDLTDNSISKYQYKLAVKQQYRL